MSEIVLMSVQVLLVLMALGASVARAAESPASQPVLISTNGTDPTTWDPKQVSTVAAPDNHRIVYEDADVRVLSVTVPAGSEEPYHHHPWPSVLVFDTQAKIIDRCAGGQPCQNKKNYAVVSSPLVIVTPPEALHSIQNIDTRDAHLMRVEFKRGTVPTLVRTAAPGTTLPRSSDGTDPRGWNPKLEGPLAAPENHKIIYDDAHLKVQALSIPPGTAEPFHDHPYPAVLVLYGDLPNDASDTDGAGHVTTTRQPGQGRYANVLIIPPHALHSGRNLGTTVHAGIRIDFKQGFPVP